MFMENSIVLPRQFLLLDKIQNMDFFKGTEFSIVKTDKWPSKINNKEQ